MIVPTSAAVLDSESERKQKECIIVIEMGASGLADSVSGARHVGIWRSAASVCVTVCGGARGG